MKWNPYFIHYAKAHGRSPEDQLSEDRKNYPGGVTTGFVCWMSGQRAAFKTAHPEAFLSDTLFDQEAWGVWLEQAGNNPCIASEPD